MESAIVEALNPEFSPVALVWSDTVPDDTLQFMEGRFGCILYLFAEASRRGRIAGGSRESITCNGGCAALGFGVAFDDSEKTLDRYAALFKPLSRTDPEENIRAVIFPVNPVELAGLLTLAGSVMEGTDSVRVAPGPDCVSLAAFSYAEAEAPAWEALAKASPSRGMEV